MVSFPPASKLNPCKHLSFSPYVPTTLSKDKTTQWRLRTSKRLQNEVKLKITIFWNVTSCTLVGLDAAAHGSTTYLFSNPEEGGNRCMFQTSSLKIHYKTCVICLPANKKITTKLQKIKATNKIINKLTGKSTYTMLVRKKNQKIPSLT